jgi:Cu-processing system permease protein
MRQLLRVALDLLLEARRRRWFLALFGAITLVLLLLGVTLELDVVDGAIAGSKLFGAVLLDDIRVGETVLGSVSFYGGALFLAVACSDFAVELLSEGRIEHLLSLPVSRWQLLFGTYLGVMALAAASVLYGAVGLTVLMGLKSGLWSWGLVAGSLVGWVGFCALYAAMLMVTFFVRSAAAAAAAGLATLVLGILSSSREAVALALEPGLGRWLFRALVMPFPRLGTLGRTSGLIAMGSPIDALATGRLVLACVIFAAALLSVATWRFERKDF